MQTGHIRQPHGRQHEDNGAPRRQTGKHGGCAARAKGSLAAHSAKRGGDIGALAVLQQHHHNQYRTNNHMNNGY